MRIFRSTVTGFFLALATASAQDSLDDGYIMMDGAASSMAALASMGHSMDGSESRMLHKQKVGVVFAPPPVMPVLPQYVQRSVPITRVSAGPVAIQRPILIAPAAVPICRENVCAPSVITSPQVVVEREEVTRIIRERSCPEGMSLEGELCVGLDVCPVNFVCPPGTVAGPDGRCITKQRPLVDCPYGFTLSRGRCTTCESSPAQLTCNGEFALDLASNLCTHAVEQPPFCPPGYTMNGGRCEQRVPAQPTCPSGFSLSVATRECVRNISSPAATVCPDGASLIDDARCVIVRQDPPRCHPRFTFDPTGQSCIQHVPRISGECPYGYNRVGGSCERVDRSPAEFYCPPDYQPIGNNQCVREIPVPPRCPAGMQHSASNPGFCERCVKEVPVCPEGTRPIGSGQSLRCELKTEQPSIECCAPGFNLIDGQCRRVEQLAPVLTCENECYETRSFPVAFTCPDDAEFVDHPVSPKCLRRNVRTICDPAPQVYSSAIRCMEEMDKPAAASSDGLRQLKGGSCTPIPQNVSNPPPCRDVTSTDTLPAQPYCPNGGELEGNRCVVRTPIVPEKVCKVGHLDALSGHCIRETIIPVKTDCPPGTQRNGKSCFSVEIRQPDFVCPQGSQPSVNGVCLVMQPEILAAPQVSRLGATPRCSSGVLSGGECLQSSRETLPTVCPAGSHETGRDCIITSELVVPPPVEKFVRPSYVCHSGALQGRQCVDTERGPIEEVCPPGTAGVGHGGCVREGNPTYPAPRVLTAPAQPICPPGSIIRGMTCVSTHESEPLVSCASGYFLEGNECVRSLEKLPICPTGTEFTGDSCVRRVTVTPLVKIVRGCVHEPVPVCDTCPRRLEKTCHAF